MDISELCNNLLTCGESLTDKTPASDVDQLFSESALLMVMLKKSNRLKLQHLDSKQQSVDALKDNVNKSQLKLENLLYKQAHLLREITDYKDYNSTELYKIESELDTKIGMDKYTSDLSTLHKNSLSILKKELQLRKLKRSELQDLEKKRDALTDELNNKRKRLETFPDKVAKIKTLAADLFSNVSAEMNTSESSIAQISQAESDDMRNIHHLVNPLYTLYHSLHSLKSNSSVDISVKITEISSNNWGVELLLSLSGLGLTTTDVVDGSSDKSTSSATVSILFEYCAAHNIVKSSISSLQFLASSGTSLSPPGNPEKSLLRGMFPHKPASIDLLLIGDTDDSKASTSGAFLWVQWICGLRALPPPGHVTSVRTNENNSGDETASIDLFYSLNTVIDAITSRMTSFWRLAASMRLLVSPKPFSSHQLCPLPPVLQTYFDLSMQRLAQSTSATLQQSSHPNSSHSLSSVDVKIQSLVPCEPPARGQASDPFIASTLLDSSSQMEVEEIDNLNRSYTVFRPENDREHCFYFKANLLLTTTSLGASNISSGTKSTTPQTHTENVIALIELSTQHPICPPQVLLTSRKIDAKKSQLPRVDNMLKGIEEELNAGCVNFLDVPTIAHQIQLLGGDTDVAADATNDVVKTISNSSMLADAMDNILLLQMSLLVQMLSAISATRAHNKGVDATDEVPLGGGRGSTEDRRSMLANCYGRNFMS